MLILLTTEKNVIKIYQFCRIKQIFFISESPLDFLSNTIKFMKI